MRICFVCLGNICRSPAAEGVMRQLVAKAGLASAITVESAGTGAWHVGELPDPRTRESAERRGLALDRLAQQFRPADLDRFELVIAMDRTNLRHLRVMLGTRKTPSLHLLRSFDPTAPADADIPDPYAGGADGFETVLDQCERACAGLLAHVRGLLAARS